MFRPSRKEKRHRKRDFIASIKKKKRNHHRKISFSLRKTPKKSSATKKRWTCEGFSFIRDTTNIPNPKSQFITVRKEKEVEVASDGELEALSLEN